MKHLTDVYLHHLLLENNASPNTITAYRRDLGKYLAFLAGRGIPDPDTVTPADATIFLHELQEQGLAPRSVMRCLSAIRGFHRFLMADGFARHDPLETIDHPRKAIHDLTLAMNLDPRLVEAQFNRAIAHQQLREYAEAIADFQAYLAVGEHPFWREHAESMIRELSEWVPNAEVDQ